MNILEIKDLSYTFQDGNKVLEDINFSIEKNETIAIIGPSGVGKSTLFNIIAKLITDIKGDIYLENENISYMLQKDLLLPFRTVFENISLPLEIKKENKKRIRNKILKHLEEFNLLGLENKYPRELSGGQRQRVALLRTYIVSSSLILLDEPFSSLDYLTKNEMYSWFNNLKNKLNLTCILITHDIDEAIYLSDKIYVMLGSPASLKYKFNVPSNKDMLNIEIIELKKKIFESLKK